MPDTKNKNFTTYSVERETRWGFNQPNPFVLFERESKPHGNGVKSRRDPSTGYAEIRHTFNTDPKQAYDARHAQLTANIETLRNNLALAEAELAELPEYAALKTIRVPLKSTEE